MIIINGINGTRQTTQRIKILEYLKSVKTHPNAEQIYKEIKKELPTISLATVYRNLHFLVQQGQIQKLELNNEFRFDGESCDHVHFFCKNCGQIIDLPLYDIAKYAMKHLNSSKFKADCVNIIFKGLCKNCIRGGKNDSRSCLYKRKM